MTEAEWLSSSKAGPMIYYLEGIGSERKLRLFAHACCCRVEHLLIDARSQRALAVLAEYADGKCGVGELESSHEEARAAVDAIEAPLYGDDGYLRANGESNAACAVLCGVSSDYTPTRHPAFSVSSLSSTAICSRDALAGTAFSRANDPADAKRAEDAENLVQAALLRDIFGNPVHPIAINRRWLTPTVVALARGIYDERAFDRLPILADALQDAGCEHPDILAHCRGDGPHARGCWVVDLVLGKT